MIDKKIVVIIGILVVVALVVLALGFVNIKFGAPGGSFSALFDKMQKEDANSTHIMLVLPSDYTVGQQIDIRDEIVSMTYDGWNTYFTFVYSGTKWVNETGGTDFDVLYKSGASIGVHDAMFTLHLSGDHRPSYSPGDLISLRTTAAARSGHVVLDPSWILVAS